MRTPIVAALLPSLLTVSGVASAHAILKQSTPPDRGALVAGERTITLRYNSRIDHDRSRLVLEGTNARIVLPLEKDSPADALVAKLDLSPGNYVVHWQVLATDGHLTRGDIRFTVTAP